ncbi:MAG: transporter substrate-binding domain-containing protein [Magnetococcales bacterium]|nr:transporter substrate-binding domain-containing protein [Magnetococcales bacterium]
MIQIPRFLKGAKRAIAATLLSGMLFFILPVSSWAANTKIPIGASEFPPFYYLEGDQLVGAAVEISDAVFTRMGYQPQFFFYPSKRLQKLTKYGDLAAAMLFTHSEERARHFLYTKPIARISDVFYKRQDSEISWQALEDLKPYVVGVSAYNYAPVFLKAMKDELFKVDLITSKTPEIQHLKKLAAGRVDLVICEINVCNHIIRKRAPQLDTLDHIDRPIGPIRDFMLVISKKWPNAIQLQERFNAELAELVADGGYRKTLDKYGIIGSWE